MKFSVVLLSLVLFSSFRQDNVVSQISLDFTQKTLEKGKYVTVEGKVYFRKKDGVLTTHLVKPFENITIVDKNGSMSIYDPATNSVIHERSSMNSTETSYFYHFLSGSYSDLGYSKAGYTFKTSRIEEGLMVTTMVPKPGYSTPVVEIELVHDKTLPVYVGFKDSRKKFLGKIFFSDFQKVSDLQVPFRITEIIFRPKGDSSITKKTYSNARVNKQVNETFLNYKIPANASVVEPK